jgi:CRISPR/Cas system CSM-associated protein Csm3 (group 7 of RAMP superfamily)
LTSSSEVVDGFHKLSSLWRIDYEVEALEPLLTKAAYEEAKEEVADMLDKTLPKPELDAVPLFVEGRAVITGNAVKGVFRHIVSAQLTEAGKRVCVQEVKKREGVDVKGLGRVQMCQPDDPCYVCRWFGTAGRQGALYFSMLWSRGGGEEVLAAEPIPMVALGEDTKALEAEKGKGKFALLAPVKKGTVFSGWITGDNLSEDIIGAIKEVQDMSERGFLKLGGFKTRGFGSVRVVIKSIEKFRAAPLSLEKKYEGEELKAFLNRCQAAYHQLILEK